MEYNYLVTYTARKNKESEEIKSTIPIILDRPIYHPEILMHVTEAIKDLHKYEDIMLMNIEVLDFEDGNMDLGCEVFHCLFSKEQEDSETMEEDHMTSNCNEEDLKIYIEMNQQLEKVFGDAVLGQEILKALVQFVCENPFCLMAMGV